MGIMMERIIKIMQEENIYLNTIDLPTDYYDGDKGISFIRELKVFIEENMK